MKSVLRIVAALLMPILAVLHVAAGFYRARYPSPGYKAGIPVELLVIVPAVLIYVLVLPFLYRSIRRWSTEQIAAFSILVVPLTGVLALASLATARWTGDFGIFFVLPILPVTLAIIASYSGVNYWHTLQARRAEQSG